MVLSKECVSEELKTVLSFCRDELARSFYCDELVCKNLFSINRKQVVHVWRPLLKKKKTKKNIFKAKVRLKYKYELAHQKKYQPRRSVRWC